MKMARLSNYIAPSSTFNSGVVVSAAKKNTPYIQVTHKLDGAKKTGKIVLRRVRYGQRKWGKKLFADLHHALPFTHCLSRHRYQTTPANDIKSELYSREAPSPIKLMNKVEEEAEISRKRKRRK